MSTPATTAVLVPGAWMGSWIWEPTAARLRARGVDAEAITLRGLAPGTPEPAIATVGLDDHVQQLVHHVTQLGPGPVVLVSHSYSGMVTASAADRLGEQVIGLIHIGAFLPQDGRSLLDDWGGSAAARAQERADILAAGNLWLQPTPAMLEHERDLTAADRDHLTSRFTPHPGRTVLDAAALSAPVDQQPSTYVALTQHGGSAEAWQDAPPLAVSAEHWRRAHLVSGHWPMVSMLEETVALLEAEIRHYASRAA